MLSVDLDSASSSIAVRFKGKFLVPSPHIFIVEESSFDSRRHANLHGTIGPVGSLAAASKRLTLFGGTHLADRQTRYVSCQPEVR